MITTHTGSSLGGDCQLFMRCLVLDDANFITKGREGSEVGGAPRLPGHFSRQPETPSANTMFTCIPAAIVGTSPCPTLPRDADLRQTLVTKAPLPTPSFLRSIHPNLGIATSTLQTRNAAAVHIMPKVIIPTHWVRRLAPDSTCMHNDSQRLQKLKVSRANMVRVAHASL